MNQWIKNIFNEDFLPGAIIFRVDGGRVKGLSFGHLARCITVARMFKKQFKAKSLFLMKDYQSGIQHVQKFPEISVEKMDKNISAREEKQSLFDSVERFGADTLVYDVPGYTFDDDMFHGLKERGVYTIFIDDDRFTSPSVDAVLNSHILASEKMNRRENVNYFLGPRYLIIDEDQAQNRKHRSILKKQDQPFTVTVTFGGSDPSALTLRVVEALISHPFDNVLYKIVLGPGYENPGQVRGMVEKNENATFSSRFEIIEAPENLYELFFNSHLVICAGGRTLYELNHFQAPAFPVASIRHEAEVIQAFKDKGLVKAGLTRWDETDFIRTFGEYVEEFRSSH
jgi:spore coat polysaccharide biosynthesis predicted glycosyltransferase SpsG